VTALPVVRAGPAVDHLTGARGGGETGAVAAGLRSPGEYPGAPGGADFELPPDVLRLWSALREVRDPELPVSLVDLGLIYDVRRADGRVDVDMTFTATGCPCMEFMKMDVEERLLREPGIDSVEIHEVWSPPWRRERMTAEARAVLKRFGVAA
jgi:metal-sulfur cluster biosynthetic enzyme